MPGKCDCSGKEANPRMGCTHSNDVERRVLGAMVREGLATSTIAAAKGLLARAIRRAQRDGLVGRNVAELAETPRGTRTESKSMPLEQIGKLFSSKLTPWWRAYCGKSRSMAR